MSNGPQLHCLCVNVYNINHLAVSLVYKIPATSYLIYTRKLCSVFLLHWHSANTVQNKLWPSGLSVVFMLIRGNNKPLKKKGCYINCISPVTTLLGQLVSPSFFSTRFILSKNVCLGNSLEQADVFCSQGDQHKFRNTADNCGQIER